MSRIGSLLNATVGMALMADALSKDLMYNDGKQVPYRKSSLSNKQLKARKKSKNAKKQRRKQRH
jgi:hypothetical protein